MNKVRSKLIFNIYVNAFCNMYKCEFYSDSREMVERL